VLAGADRQPVRREFCSDRSHNAELFGPLTEVLHGIAPRDIGLVLVGSGPGSYSGTRVGIAAAQGVALAAGCPVVAVPSILAAPAAANGAACRLVGDARRGSFWIARVAHGQVALAPELTDEAGLRRFVDESNEEPVVTFEAGTRNALPAELTIRHEAPTAALLWEAWQRTVVADRQHWLAEAPQPLYLRPPHITEAKKKF
jgi:tRNA threonylcarbamoyladenosine biosynthesis protein TsaB